MLRMMIYELYYFVYFYMCKKNIMSSKFFGNGKLKGQLNKNQKNKFKSGSKGKATTAIRKTGRGN